MYKFLCGVCTGSPVHVGTHMHVEASDQCWKSLFDCLSPLHCPTEIHTKPEASRFRLSILFRLGWPMSFNGPLVFDPASPLQHWGLQTCIIVHGYSCGCWGSESWFSCSHGSSLQPLHFLLNPELPQKRQYWLPLYYYLTASLCKVFSLSAILHTQCPCFI